MLVEVGLTVIVPEAAIAPDQAPEAMQLVAFIDDQVSKLVPPTVIELGEAFRDTVGAGGGGFVPFDELPVVAVCDLKLLLQFTSTRTNSPNNIFLAI